ncbi:hypothetical protein MLD38_027939 [Melastoma candidum]|uniref:Uncharacterized protein n=1 Tax=Melastoma candidum TaxID=119954 RepID=A0ACB9MZM2_9MYRT|nr:hypothetical protein MLD38_027939 [Melastoma candidum]
MAVVECLDVGLTTVTKSAMSRGMNRFVFLVYSNALACALLLPVAAFLTRGTRTRLGFSILLKFFLLSLVGITAMQNCVFAGLSYSSPTLASAMANLVPAFTFVLAVIFRIENVDIRSFRCQIKILGTLLSISGASVVILYKGPRIGSNTWSLHYTKSLPPLQSSEALLETVPGWVIGGLFLGTASFCLATWNTAQAVILKDCPSEITLVSFCCLFGAFQCAIVALAAERNPKAWRVRPQVELIPVIYSALAGNVITFCTISWCIHKKGPIFVAMFKPLSIAIAAIMSAIFLGESLHVGSVMGAIIIVVGFYGVIWAMSREARTTEALDPPHSSSPLLERGNQMI